MQEQEFHLGLGVVAKTNVPYKEMARRLLEEASKFTPKYDKKFISPKGLESLIGAGAEIKNLNMKSSGALTYTSEVVFEGIKFVTSSVDPIIYTISQALK